MFSSNDHEVASDRSDNESRSTIDDSRYLRSIVRNFFSANNALLLTFQRAYLTLSESILVPWLFELFTVCSPIGLSTAQFSTGKFPMKTFD